MAELLDWGAVAAFATIDGHYSVIGLFFCTNPCKPDFNHLDCSSSNLDFAG